MTLNATRHSPAFDIVAVAREGHLRPPEGAQRCDGPAGGIRATRQADEQAERNSAMPTAACRINPNSTWPAIAGEPPPCPLRSKRNGHSRKRPSHTEWTKHRRM